MTSRLRRPGTRAIGDSASPAEPSQEHGGSRAAAAVLPQSGLLNLPPEAWPGEGYRRLQLLDWVYRRGEVDFAAMTNLPRTWREELALKHTLVTAREVQEYASADGARRFLITLADGQLTECVLMPYADRLTVCLSSMVGCPAGCSFCATGALGYGRNLTTGEILEQLCFAARAAKVAPRRLTNLVFMGMGEPLLNYPAFMSAVRTMVHPQGLAFSPRRITVSTVGLPSGILRLAAEDLPLRLAISLHAPDDQTRRELMPVAHRHLVSEVLAAAGVYFQRTGRRITFEYTLIAGVNDRLEQADMLARRVQGIAGHVNLIPFNPWPGTAFRRPAAGQVQAFVNRLRQRGLNATVRHSRGQDAGAACGQLAAARTPEPKLPSWGGPNGGPDREGGAADSLARSLDEGCEPPKLQRRRTARKRPGKALEA